MSDSYLAIPLVEVKTVIMKVPCGVKDNEEIEKAREFRTDKVTIDHVAM